MIVPVQGCRHCRFEGLSPSLPTEVAEPLILKLSGRPVTPIRLVKSEVDVVLLHVLAVPLPQVPEVHIGQSDTPHSGFLHVGAVRASIVPCVHLAPMHHAQGGQHPKETQTQLRVRNAPRGQSTLNCIRAAASSVPQTLWILVLTPEAIRAHFRCSDCPLKQSSRHFLIGVPLRVGHPGELQPVERHYPLELWEDPRAVLGHTHAEGVRQLTCSLDSNPFEGV